MRQDWELERHVVTEHAAWHAAGVASDGSRRMVGARHNIKPYPLPSEPAGKINVTDPDSRNLKTTRGWVQGYNAQAVVGEGQIILAAEISTESLDTANLAPMIQTAIGELETAGVTETPGVVLADAGYWKNDAIETLCGEGIPTLVAPDADRRKEPRPGRRGGPYDFARRVLATDWGKDALPQAPGQRSSPSSGRSRANRGADRFQRRGQISRQIGMAAPDRDPQPPQTPPTPTRHRLTVRGQRRRTGCDSAGLRNGLATPARRAPVSRRADLPHSHTFPRHPPRIPEARGRSRWTARSSSQASVRSIRAETPAAVDEQRVSAAGRKRAFRERWWRRSALARPGHGACFVES